MIFDNSGRLDHIDGVNVIRSPRNIGTYGRRLAAHHAKHDLIFTQDDDCLIQNVPQLLAAYLEKPDCITAGLSQGHYRIEANKTDWLQLGWGSWQKREWFDNVEQYIACYGVDDLLLSKFDRVYSVLHARHNPLVANFTRLKGPDGTDSDRDASSLWLQKNHWKLRDEAVARAVAIRDSAAPGSVC